MTMLVGEARLLADRRSTSREIGPGMANSARPRLAAIQSFDDGRAA